MHFKTWFPPLRLERVIMRGVGTISWFREPCSTCMSLLDGFWLREVGEIYGSEDSPVFWRHISDSFGIELHVELVGEYFSWYWRIYNEFAERRRATSRCKSHGDYLVARLKVDFTSNEYLPFSGSDVKSKRNIWDQGSCSWKWQQNHYIDQKVAACVCVHFQQCFQSFRHIFWGKCQV